MQNILAMLYGLVFGIANVIPGVSGGTMLVVFGCYDKVCGALTLNLKEIKKNIVFLIFFGIGAVIGIVGFAFIITWLFTNFPTQTNMFFMGLIIGSVPLIIRNATVKDKFKPICIVPFIIGLAAVVGLAIAENGSSDPYRFETAVDGDYTSITIYNDSDRVVNEWEIDLVEGILDPKAATQTTGGKVIISESTLSKVLNLFGVTSTDVIDEHNAIINEDNTVIEPHSSHTITFWNYDSSNINPEIFELSVSYKMDVKFFLTMMAALFIAAIAMIIPGVSGSFVMMTLGVYSTIIAAVKDLDFAIIIPCAIGAVIGLVAGARLITWLMKKYSLIVYSVILGLVAGSLYVIFPVGFGLNIATLTGALCLAVGAVVAVIVGKNTKIGE